MWNCDYSATISFDIFLLFVTVRDMLLFVAALATYVVISPGHTMRCFTPAMVCSKGTAMSHIPMRCAAMES